MLRNTLIISLIALAAPAMAADTPVAPAPAAAAPAASASGYSVENTDIGTLLDDPAAKAVVEANFPGMTTNPQIDMARSMTLKQIQSFKPDEITDAKLAAVQAGLDKLPAPAKK